MWQEAVTVGSYSMSAFSVLTRRDRSLPPDAADNELPRTVGDERSRGSGDGGGAEEAEVTMVCGPMPPDQDLDQRIYSVATDRTINSLMTQYKKRKQVRVTSRHITSRSICELLGTDGRR